MRGGNTENPASVPFLPVGSTSNYNRRALSPSPMAMGLASPTSAPKPTPFRRASPTQTRPTHRTKNAGSIAPGQPLPAGRQRDKFVPLPDDGDSDPEASLQQNLNVVPSAAAYHHEGVVGTPRIFEDLPQIVIPDDGSSRRGRITLYCLAESFDRKKLDSLLQITYPESSIGSYPDCYYVEYIKGVGSEPGADLFFFDYGVVACWGMNKAQEMTIVRGLARQVMVQPLPDREIEVDEFQYNYSVMEKPNVQNDMVTLHKRFAQDHRMKLAISYALAQSTKLSAYETRVVDIVLETKNLPESLADSGAVHMSSKDIAKLIGKVFLQKSAVNLLSSVLDTPEFFWHAPDSMGTLYNRLTEYLELPNRIELLNSRFSVLQEMLDMLRDHQNNYHSVRLEMVVIWLIVVEVVVGCLELLGLFGIVGNETQ